MLKNFLRFALSAAALAALVLSQQPAPRPPAAQPPPAPALQSGIKVHGRWTIVVRNPDGSVASRHEFENSLQLDGATLLPAVLGGFATPGSMVIALGAQSSGGACSSGEVWVFNSASGAQVTLKGPCFIAGSAGAIGPLVGCSEFSSFTCATTLSTSLVQTGSLSTVNGPQPLVALQLTGTLQIPQNGGGSIDTVATEMGICGYVPPGPLSFSPLPITKATISSISPAACATPGGTWYTSTAGSNAWVATMASLAPPGITVIPQQTVEVTVLISFS